MGLMIMSKHFLLLTEFVYMDFSIVFFIMLFFFLLFLEGDWLPIGARGIIWPPYG